MITWIQETLHKHLKTIFIFLLIVVGASFIGTVGRSPGLVASAREVKPLEYYGYNLRSAKDVAFLRKAAFISNQLNTGMPPFSDEQVETLVRMRPALLWVADRLELPAPTEKQLEDFLRSRPLFKNTDGAFDSKRYQSFMESSKDESETILLVLEQDYRMQQVQKLIEGPGYALDYESRRILEIAHTRWTVEEATLDARSFEPTLNEDVEALRAYFENNKPNYFRKKQVRASYVLFAPDAYLAAIADPDFEAIAQARKKDFNDSSDLSDEQIAQFIKRGLAKKEAQQAAYGFQYALFEKNIAYGSPEFQALVKASSLKLKALEAFDPELGLEQFAAIEKKDWRQLLELDAKQYYSNPISAGGFYILFFLDEALPQMPLTFEDAQALVSLDYAAEEKAKQFRAQGERLREQLAASLAQDSGASFTELAEKNGFKANTYESFSLEEPPASLTHTAFEILQTLNVGDVSPFFVEGNSGHVFYVVSKLLPSSVEYEETLSQIKKYQENSASSLRSIAVLRHLIKPALKE